MKLYRRILVLVVSLVLIFPLFLVNSALANGIILLAKFKENPRPKLDSITKMEKRITLDEYFPCKEGNVMSWKIKIILPFGAQSYHKIFWPEGDYLRITSHADGLADAKGLSEPNEGYRLEIKVGEKTFIPNPMVNTYGYKINILRDDAGVYQFIKEIYWVKNYKKLLVYEFLVLKDNLLFDLRKENNRKNGFALHLLFYLGKNFTSYSFNSSKEDTLSLMTKLLNSDEQEGLFFVRKINNGKITLFTESLVYQKGMGLKELTQYFMDKITMEWERLP